MATRMQQRRGTAAEWTAADPILGSGEIGFETDTSKFKIGDGTNVWSSLTYFTSINEILDGSPETLDTLNELAAAINDDPDFFTTIISRTLNDLPDVSITSVSDHDVLTYNSAAGEWINQPGIPLDANLDIPLSYLTELSDDVDTRIAGFGTTTVQTEAEWTADASIPSLGSLNISTGASVRAKIGDGINVFDSLEYIPNNSYLAAEIATALADYATKASPTFSGTVSLPATTSIGDVSDAEIAHLDGVTSGIQGQLDTKAPTADPTFTGTVSGITKSMVGLGNVNDTADADKPVSTATQAALDAKAALAGATFTGDVEAPNLTITGNLTVSGTTTTISTSDLSVKDNMIYLNQGGYFTVTGAVGDGTNVVYTTSETHNAQVGDYIVVTGITPSALNISGEGLEVQSVTDTTITVLKTDTDTYVSGGTLRAKSHANPDLGWAAGRYDVVNGSGYGHAGIFRDASDGVFKFFDGYIPEPDESVFIDTADASFALAPIAPSKVVFPDGTEQTKAGVPSLTSFTQKEDTVQTATITNAVGDQTNVVFTTSADHGFSESDTVVISGMEEWFNGTYTIINTPSTTSFTVVNNTGEPYTTGGTATVTTPGNYTLDTLAHQDNIVEMNSSVGATFTIPTDAALAWPVGASMDVFATGTGEITIAGDTGVTVNATPGLILRTQWSSATILKRGADSWVVYGDLKA